MKDLPGLRFRFTNHPVIEVPVEVLMELFDRIKDRASPVVTMRQYLRSPMRLDDLSEIELAAIVSVVQTVRQEGPTIVSPLDVVKITELTREWVKLCYKRWSKGKPRTLISLPGESPKSGTIEDPGGNA